MSKKSNKHLKEVGKQYWIWFLIIFLFLLPSLLMIFSHSEADKNFDFAVSIFAEIFGILVTVFLIEQYIRDQLLGRAHRANEILYFNMLIKIRLFIKENELILMPEGSAAEPPGLYPQKRMIGLTNKAFALSEGEFLHFVRGIHIDLFVDTLDATVQAGKDTFETEIYDKIREVNLCYFKLQEALLTTQQSKGSFDIAQIKNLFVQFIGTVLNLQDLLGDMAQPADR